jgi:hypothetical protein
MPRFAHVYYPWVSGEGVTTEVVIDSLTLDDLSPPNVACELIPRNLIQDRDTQESYAVPRGLAIRDHNIHLARELRLIAFRVTSSAASRPDR